MVETRKPRERRESAAKRRASSPPPNPVGRPRKKPVPPSSPPPPPPEEEDVPVAIEEILPGKLKDGVPLPTLREPQPFNLSLAEYQSVAESGVLAASLQRSRNKWLAGGMFEKYWSKPSKKKGIDAQQYPDKHTMSKVGQCTMAIEPHHFDIIFYSVRDPSMLPPGQQYRYQQPAFVQYGSPNGNHQYHPPPPPPLTLSPTLPPPPPQPNQYAPQDQTTNPPPPPPPPPTTQPPPQQQQPQQQHPPSNNSPALLTWQSSASPPPPPQRPPQPQVAPPKPSTDPVIQMLATRAAADPDLKALMRVVASSKASQEQLRAFQAHIDELNALIAQQNINKPAETPPQMHHQTSAQTQPNRQSNSTPPTAVPPNFVPPATAAPPRSSPSPYGPYQTPPQGPSTPQPLRAKGHAAPPYQPYPPHHHQYPMQPVPPTALAFEFLSPSSSGFTSSGDRFLFPAYSILDFIQGATPQVMASFLVVRKGSEIMASNPGPGSSFYHPDTDYWQPVTVRLSANNPKIFQTLSSVVKAPGEVRKYMEDVMDRCERAEYVYLATRLPREVPIGAGSHSNGVVEHLSAKDKMDPDCVVVERERQEPSGKVEPLKERYEGPSMLPPFRGWGWNWKS